MIADFTDRYDSIVVFGHYRYGSTVLCDLLRNWLKAHGTTSEDWNEFLHANKYLTVVDGQWVSRSLTADYLDFGQEKVSFIDKPESLYMTELRFQHFTRIKKQRFVVLKIAPDDFADGKHELIKKYLLDDPRVFKLALNRVSVGKSLISFCQGIYHNVWNEEALRLRELWDGEITPVRADLGLISGYIDKTLAHNNWLLYNCHRFHDMVWYEDLKNLNIPAMGMRDFHDTKIAKHHIDHETRARRYFTNADDLLALADEFERVMRPMIENVRMIWQDHRKTWPTQSP